MARSPLVSGSKVALFINGVMFGRVAAFNYTSATARKPAHCVDVQTPFELMPTITTVSGSMTVYRLHDDGAAEGAGMVAPIDELPNEKYFTMVLYNTVTGRVIFQAEFCSVDSQSWNYNAKSLAMGTITFQAIRYENEVRRAG
jgi:hypothetical protein